MRGVCAAVGGDGDPPLEETRGVATGRRGGVLMDAYIEKFERVGGRWF